MRPRILIFSIAYEPLVGGAEVAVRNITDRLSSYEFDLITCRFDQKEPSREKIGNVNVYRVGFGSRLGRYLYPVLAFRLAKKLHTERPYQITWAIMAAYAGAGAVMFLRRFPEVKFLLTLQEGDSVEHIHGRVRGFKKQWRKIFQRADYIQAISRYLADWAKREGARCPIEVVPNGVDLQKFKAQSAKRKVEKGNKKIIITTSRLVPKNGVDLLIHAGAALKTLFPERGFAIWILGVGPDEPKLKTLVHKLGLDAEVKFFGLVSADRLAEFLAQADVFVRPSRSEGLGNAFLEAMAVGVPVIGTRVGGIPEFLTDRVTGLFTKTDDPKDLADKIVELIQNPELRQTLVKNGRNLVQDKYEWTKIASQMGLIFNRLSQ